MKENENILNVIALRGLVVFPGMHLQFEIGREKSINALLDTAKRKENIFLVGQKQANIEEPSFDELYNVGVICNIEQIIKSPNSNVIRIAIEGLKKAEIISDCSSDEPFLKAEVRPIEQIPCNNSDPYILGLIDLLKDYFNAYVTITRKLSQSILMDVFDSKDLSETINLIASNCIDEYEKRQLILEENNPVEAGKLLCSILENLTEIAKLRYDIEDEVHSRMDDSQREYFLREQIKVINEELGIDDANEIESFRDKIKKLPLEEKFIEKLLKECSRLEKMQTISPEATVCRTYIEEVLSLPWGKADKENSDIEKARKILDKGHYGLDKVKERFTEMMCSYLLGANPSSQILCLIGPPGIGKTSIAQNAAKAMGRSFARVSLGGISDEAEIRGHRKTYIGAMPGRIIAAIKQAGASNAMILLDEIDKLGKDYKGDPASALLEVLDPEQNKSFVDHFIDLPFDLSKIIFVTTANDASSIPAALYDRMEKIELDSYTFEEKLNIASKHLIKKQLKNYGLTKSQLTISKKALGEIIDKYTREAGVRLLESKIASICRKTAVKIVSGEEKVIIKPDNLYEFLGHPKYKDTIKSEDKTGVVNGLAWTSVGGEMLQVEAVVLDGTGKIELTGNLGDVMKESAKVAHSFARSVCTVYNLENDFFKTKDIHIHVPEGAVAKDGPSAGATIATALISALSGRKVKGDIAMTGEITLTGRVTAIGGLKEKSMAAYKNNIKTVFIPSDNLSDLDEICDEVKKNITFKPVNSVSEILDYVLL